MWTKAQAATLAKTEREIRENRESVVDRPLSDNRLYDRLLAPYRVMVA